LFPQGDEYVEYSTVEALFQSRAKLPKLAEAEAGGASQGEGEREKSRAEFFGGS
jgi:hypothetical protein